MGQRVYAWASQNTQEARLSNNYKYYWPEVATKLLQTLEISQGSVIALVGLSGVGKSSALSEIAKKLGEKFGEASVLRIKWPGSIEQNSDRFIEFLEQQRITGTEEIILEIVRSAFEKKSESMLSKELDRMLESKWWKAKRLPREEMEKSLVTAFKDQDTQVLARRLLGRSDEKRWKVELAIHLLSRCHSILLDLRDYGMKDVRAMNTDIREIQYVWQRIIEHLESRGETRAPNFVFVLQKELAYSEEAKAANYYLGKARTFEINPFSPKDLVKAYIDEFGSSYPFGESLGFAARLSRGIFRRFLRYLALSLELHRSTGKSMDEPVSEDTVNDALREELEKDWESDLKQIFHGGIQLTFALKMLTVLSRTEEFIPQEEFANLFDGISRSEASRILTKLGEYGFVTRIWKDRERLVKLDVST